MIFGPYLWLVLIGLVASMAVQAYLRSTYGRYSKVRAASNRSGARAARDILDANGLRNVQVKMVPGVLTDHYDPRTRTVALSEHNYNTPSLAAVSVAAHEAGHAIQHAQQYAPLQWRANLLPVAMIGSNLGPWLVIIGAFFLAGSQFGIELAFIGLALFSGAALFQVVTLPVEFDASNRAVVQLTRLGIVGSQELAGARSVLNAAALTYVAALAMTLLQILQLLMMVLAARRS